VNRYALSLHRRLIAFRLFDGASIELNALARFQAPGHVGFDLLADPDPAVRELAGFFPEVKRAKLLKAAVTKEVRATYSIRPGLDRIRPAAQSPWPGIYLAGDWIATGWPSTMESGVRSGYLAAEAITRDSGAARNFLVPDLPPTGLMRFLK